MSMSPEQFAAHYALDIDLIDSDHWKLISAMNVINEAIKSNNTVAVKEGSAILLKELRIHCAREEAYMIKINYPFFKYHRDCHAALIRTMTHLVESIPITLYAQPTTTDTLYSVFVTHIDTIDLQIRDYVVKNNLQTETHI